MNSTAISLSVDGAQHPMRWATWWIWFCLPVSALSNLGGGIELYRSEAGFLVAAGFISTILAILQISVAAGLASGHLNAWRLNFVVVAFASLLATVSPLVGDPTFAGLVRSAFALPVVLTAFTLPSVIYWRKRRSNFDRSPPKPLVKQWILVPALGWAGLVALCVGALIAPQAGSVPEQSREVPSGRSFDGAAGRPACAPGANYDPVRQACVVTAAPPAPAPAPAPSESSEEDRWDADVSAFLARRCEFSDPNPAAAEHVAFNKRVLQEALNEVARPDMRNLEMLAAAAERAYAYPGFTPRGTCPSDQIASRTPTHAAPFPARGRVDTGVKPKCEYKAAMSDEEIAICQRRR